MSEDHEKSKTHDNRILDKEIFDKGRKLFD